MNKITIQKNLVGDSWIDSSNRAVIQVTNPATNEIIASVPNCGEIETLLAINSAKNAFKLWKNKTAAFRAEKIHNLAKLMLEDKERLAQIMTKEQGKPLSESRGEIEYAVSFLTWAAEEGKRLYGDIIPASHENKRIFVIKQPVGVVACVTPWNFPSAMITRKIGPALAAGCTAIVKPASETPLSALAIGELALKAGIPGGVLNIITGDPEPIVNTLLEDKDVRKISFTGSTFIGKKLMKKAAETVTRVSMELGGHAPFIVFDDADLEKAVSAAVACKYRNMGQTCVCANRFYIQKKIYKKFVEKFQKAVLKLQVGNGLDNGVNIGPLISDKAIKTVRSHVEDALAKGAKLLVGGKQIQPDESLSNRFFEATILENCTNEMLIFQDETFGPVSGIQQFDTEEEVIEKANNTNYGLASYFFTQDASRLMRVAEQLEYGIVGANDGGPSTAQAPFGGFKESGVGREGGKYVMEEYTETKYISWAL